MHRQRAFTLVEILIVVVILGVLAAIVVPQFSDASEEARRGAFVANLKYFADQCEYYAFRAGQYPPDGGSGDLPAELEDFIRPEDFENGTPIGGVWDTEFNDNGVGAAVGVHFDGTGETREDPFMLLVDAQFDDNDLASGVFRKLADDRYYYVLLD